VLRYQDTCVNAHADCRFFFLNVIMLTRYCFDFVKLRDAISVVCIICIFCINVYYVR
jgi:hypothetical protein